MPRTATILSVDRDCPQWDSIRLAASAIRRGLLVATSTDTLYGLAADPFNRRAVRELFRVKRRRENRPILLLIDSPRRLNGLIVNPPDLFHTLAARFWPGPLTMILEADRRIPREVTAGSGTIAVRLPRAAIPRALVRAAGRPLTGSSANLSGLPAARTAAEVTLQLGARVPYIVDGGRAPSLTPSTILDLTGEPRVLRDGALSAAALRPYLR